MTSCCGHLTSADPRRSLTCSAWQGALAARSAYGGTAPVRVAEQLEAARDRVADDAAWTRVSSS